MQLPGYDEFRNLNRELSEVQDRAGLLKAAGSEAAPKPVRVALEVLKNQQNLAQLGLDAELRQAATQLMGRFKPLADSKVPIAQDIVSVCSRILGGKEPVASRVRASSFADPTRRLSAVLGQDFAAALRDAREGQLLSPRHEPFTRDELSVLFDLHKFIDRKPGAPRPSEAECRKFAQLFLKARGNLEVNGQMKELLAALEPSSISAVIPKNIPPRDVLQLFVEFSFRTKELQNPTQSVQKLEQLVTGFFDNKEANEKDKFSMSELGALESFRKCASACDMVRDLQLGKFDPSGDLTAIAKANHKTCLLIDQIEHSLSKRSNFRPGDIVSTVPHRMAALRSRPVTAAEQQKVKMQDNIPTVHTAVVFRAKDGSEKLSHIVDRLEIDDFGLLDRLSMVGVRIDPLILYNGSNLDEVKDIPARFQEITNSMHQDVSPDQMQLPNSALSRAKAGIFSKLNLTNTVFSRKTGNWTQEFNDLVQSRPGERPQQDMICSAWGALSQAAAIQQLGVCKNPFPQNKKLQLMTPASLLQQLSKAGCISIVEPEPMLAALVKKEELTPPDRLVELCQGKVVKTPTVVAVEVTEATPSFLQVPERNPELLKSKWVAPSECEEVSSRIAAKTKDERHELVRAQRTVIKERKEAVRDFVGKNEDVFGLRQVATEQMRLIKGGTGGTYIAGGEKRVIVKPDDEAPLSLHNPKGNASCLPGRCLRATIPPGEDAMRARLTFQVSELLGLGCTPKTEVAILRADAFHDITDNLVPTRFKQLGKPEREKVCSVQEFVENSQSIEEYIAEQEGLTTTHDLTQKQVMHRLVERVDPQSLEDVVLLCCLTGATDANPGNILLVPKEPPSGHDGPYSGLTLIDTPLSWPDAKGEFSVFFKGLLPLTDRPLSEVTVRRILMLPKDAIVDQLRMHGLNDRAVSALEKRIEIMQQVVKHENATIEDLLESIDRGKDMVAARNEPQPDADELIAGMLAGGPSSLVSPKQDSMNTSE